MKLAGVALVDHLIDGASALSLDTRITARPAPIGEGEGRHCGSFILLTGVMMIRTPVLGARHGATRIGRKGNDCGHKQFEMLLQQINCLNVDDESMRENRRATAAR